MNSIKKILMALAALAALAVGGATIANATGAGAARRHRASTDASLIGTSSGDRAATAATDKLGGGKVLEVEKSDENGPAVYEVKVEKAGTVTEVQVDDSYAVTATKADDDQEEGHDDGDGESDDD